MHACVCVCAIYAIYILHVSKKFRLRIFFCFNPCKHGLLPAGLGYGWAQHMSFGLGLGPLLLGWEEWGYVFHVL